MKAVQYQDSLQRNTRYSYHVTHLKKAASSTSSLSSILNDHILTIKKNNNHIVQSDVCKWSNYRRQRSSRTSDWSAVTSHTSPVYSWSITAPAAALSV